MSKSILRTFDREFRTDKFVRKSSNGYCKLGGEPGAYTIVERGGFDEFRWAEGRTPAGKTLKDVRRTARRWFRRS